MNTKLITVIALLSAFCGSAQEKVFKDKLNKVTTEAQAVLYETSTFSEDKSHQTIRTFRMDETPIAERTYAILETGGMPDGKETLFNPDGSVEWYANYSNGKLEGESKAFWPNRSVRREETYVNNKLVTGKCYDENGVEIPYFPREQRPEYPGGIQEAYKYISNNFKVRGNAQGTIYLTFAVDTDGSVTEVKIKKGINWKLDKEAIRVVESMPKWTPGMIEGKPVRALYSLPIKIAQR